MSRVIGRGRYATETYPQSPSAGGGGSSIVPLSRQRFIDGDTATTGRTGSAADPFKTIAEFIASRTNVSIEDASANYVGWLMPALAGYSENISFPPYAATELRGDSFSIAIGVSTSITGNVTWNNVAGAHAASSRAAAVMHNLNVTGTFTVTDDAGAPQSSVIFGGDEAGGNSAFLAGLFDSSTATKLAGVNFLNAVLNSGINCGTTIDSAAVTCTQSTISGAIAAGSLSGFDSTFSSPTIAVHALNNALFLNCRFLQATALTCLAGASFDGPSWRSFQEAGGTRSVGTTVLVVGGYNAGAVEGGALTNTDIDVSLNGANASGAAWQGENSGNHYTSSIVLTGDRTVTLKTGGGEKTGDTLLITRARNTDAFVLAVKNNAGTVIGTIPVSSFGFVLAQFDGTDWAFAEGGSLAA